MKQFINPKTGKTDYLNGDHSFKQFWKIMANQNKYIYLLFAFLVLLIIEIVNYKTVIIALISAFLESLFAGILCSLGILIPICACIILIVNIYKFWKELTGN